jgi:hypothetical protein
MSGLSWGEITLWLILLGLAIVGLLVREARIDAAEREPDGYGDGQ